jgi:hypothetical protein
MKSIYQILLHLLANFFKYLPEIYITVCDYHLSRFSILTFYFPGCKASMCIDTNCVCYGLGQQNCEYGHTASLSHHIRWILFFVILELWPTSIAQCQIWWCSFKTWLSVIFYTDWKHFVCAINMKVVMILLVVYIFFLLLLVNVEHFTFFSLVQRPPYLCIDHIGYG